MRMKFLYIMFLPLSLLASSGGGGEYDIVARTINFILFAGILYYLLANPLKDFYKNRIAGISARLENIQKKLLDSKNKKDQAVKKVEDAKLSARDIIETVKKEVEILTQKGKKDLENELASLEKSFSEQKDFEKRRVLRAVVSEVLDELFAKEAIKMEQKELVNIVLKKVG